MLTLGLVTFEVNGRGLSIFNSLNEANLLVLTQLFSNLNILVILAHYIVVLLLKSSTSLTVIKLFTFQNVFTISYWDLQLLLTTYRGGVTQRTLRSTR